MKLKILGEVHVPLFTDSYEVQVKYMGGDANSYFTNEFIYEKRDMQDLELALKGLNFMQHKMESRQPKFFNEQAIEEFFNTLGCESVEDEDEDSDTYLEIIRHEKTEDFMQDYLLNDDTDESYDYNAKVVGVNVFYYDAVGRKFHMEVTHED